MGSGRETGRAPALLDRKYPEDAASGGEILYYCQQADGGAERQNPAQEAVSRVCRAVYFPCHKKDRRVRRPIEHRLAGFEAITHWLLRQATIPLHATSPTTGRATNSVSTGWPATSTRASSRNAPAWTNATGQ